MHTRTTCTRIPRAQFVSPWRILVALITCFGAIFRDAETQTKRDSSTNVPKPSTFVAGLRGCNSTKTTMNVVDLTLDVDQT